MKKENRDGMSQNKFHKILVANRGEIALRVIRAIQKLDKLAVVVHSEFDRDLPFVTEADEAYSLGSGTLADTYLDQQKIVQIALSAQVDAIHPGYGFLSENQEFALLCENNGIRFIGPSHRVIELMGQKSNAREEARKLGLPVLDGRVDTLEALVSGKDDLPFPVLIKPAAGGGGKGMRIVYSPETFETEAREAAREAKNYFGSGELYVERYLENPRHIEVQVLADEHGNGVHLFERECSLQRRYQKIIEEAPSGSISPETRKSITSSALDLVRGINYTNAGTVEYLVDETQNFYFLEMNTRIQVEHPVTEMVTGIDLVMEQIRISEGYPLSFTQEDITLNGHSIEARLYAEDPEKEFMPSTGRIDTFQVPRIAGARFDSGFRRGNLVEPWYDPMLAKVVSTGTSRTEAINQLIRVLKEFRVSGLKTNRDFLIELLRSDAFLENRIHTAFVDTELNNLIGSNRERRSAMEVDLLLAAATLISLQQPQNGTAESGSPWKRIGHWRLIPEMTLEAGNEQYRIRYELQKGRERLRIHLGESTYQVGLERRDGDEYWIRFNNQVLKVWGKTDRSEILLDLDGHLHRLRRLDILDRRYISTTDGTKNQNTGEILAPLNGRIVQISVKEGETITRGDTLVVIESMKMENKILATHDTAVSDIHIHVGDQVQANQLIITLEST